MKKAKTAANSLSQINRLQLLYDGLPLVIIANLLLAVVLVSELWTAMPHQALLAWLMADTGVLLVGALLWIKQKQALIQTDKHIQFWFLCLRVLMLVTAAMWSYACWNFHTGDMAEHVFLAFILMGACASVAITMYADHSCVLGFTIIIISTVVLNFIGFHGEISHKVGVLILIFIAILTASISRYRKELATNEALVEEAFQQQRVLDIQNQVAEIITRAQSRYIHEAEHLHAFDLLLADVVQVSQSGFGFIAELEDKHGSPLVALHATPVIRQNALFFNFYQTALLQLNNTNTLGVHLRDVILNGHAVVLNEAALTDLPDAHPKVNNLVCMPIFDGGELVGVFGLFNRAIGFRDACVDYLRPLITTVGQLISAARIKQEHISNQHELARLSQLASQTMNGVIVTDNNLHITWINEAHTRITGYRLDEILGKKPHDFLHGPLTDLNVLAELEAALVRDEDAQAELVNYTKEGKPHWVRVHCNPIWNKAGQKEGYMAIINDITNEKKAEQDLQNTTKLLESIVDNVPSMIVLKDAEQLRFEFINKAGEQLLGRSRDEVLGCNDYDLFTKEQAAFFSAKDREVLAQHKVVEIPQEDILTTQGIRTIHTLKMALRDEYGEPQYMLAIANDITDYLHAAEAVKLSEARLRGLFEFSPIGIALNDYETGEFIDVNQSLVKPTGYTESEFLTLSYWDLTPESYAQQETEQLELMEKNGRYGPYEKEYIRKDGSRYPVSLNGMVVYDDSGRKLIWSMVEDISDRKRNEKMKNEFIAVVSHELRTPVTSITGALGLVLGGVVGELNASMREMLEISYQNCQRLTALINDLLDMEKLESGQIVLSMAEQSLAELLQTAVKENSAYAERLNVALVLEHCDDNLMVNVDAMRFEQVMTNLLSNAAKFSKAGGEVLINAVKSGDHVRIMVNDQGEGIPEQFHQMIFEKFIQADSSDSRQKGGSGLGLAITKELVEKMGGSIAFESAPGQGTIFYFDLPLVAAVKQRH